MTSFPRILAVPVTSGVPATSGVGVTMAVAGIFAGSALTAIPTLDRESRTPTITPPSAVDNSTTGDGTLNVDVSVNGPAISTGYVPCSAIRIGQLCNSAQGWPLDADHFFRAAGGDTVTVHAYGFGLAETKSASIPLDMENCPQPEPVSVPKQSPIRSVSDETVASPTPTVV